ncbi:hypothetical protein, partial [Aeromonas rivipollensis]|uniref:hypothetical protein n=1 Tax=Aeromonas rivipollensis TaxID=948519 RepID=UPI003D214FE9
MWLRQLGVILCWCSLVLSVTSTRADDTELFIYDFNKAGDFRPKVLANSTSKCNSRLKIRLLSEVRQKPPV